MNLVEDEEAINKMLMELKNANRKNTNIEKTSEIIENGISEDANSGLKSSISDDFPIKKNKASTPAKKRLQKKEKILHETEDKKLSKEIKKESIKTKTTSNVIKNKKNVAKTIESEQLSIVDDLSESGSDTINHNQTITTIVSSNDQQENIIKEIEYDNKINTSLRYASEEITPTKKERKKFSEVIKTIKAENPPEKRSNLVFTEGKNISSDKKTIRRLKQNILSPSPNNLDSLAFDIPIVNDSGNNQEISLKTKKVINKPLPKELTLENIDNYLNQMLPNEHAKLLKDFIALLTSKAEKDKKNNDEIASPLICQEESLEPESNTDQLYGNLSIQIDRRPILYKKSSFIKKTIKTIFNQEEIEKLSPKIQMKVNKYLVGHDLHCEDICEHLKRVLAIKNKTFGMRYPINTPIIKLLV